MSSARRFTGIGATAAALGIVLTGCLPPKAPPPAPPPSPPPQLVDGKTNAAIPGLWHSFGPDTAKGTMCRWGRTNTLDDPPPYANTIGVGNSDLAWGGGPQYVQILPTDVGFWSQGCQNWVQADGPLDKLFTAGPANGLDRQVIKNGEYRVGPEADPGTYEMQPVVEPPGLDSPCFWQRLSGFTGLPSGADPQAARPVIDEGRPQLGQVGFVTIQPGDVGFKSFACNDWVKVS
jgi:hypothetical protein